MPKKEIRLALLGGDMRQLSAAKELSRRGFCTSVWGISQSLCEAEGICSSENWQTAVCDCDVLILPLPVSTDGIHVNCPLLGDDVGAKISKILDALSPQTLILGGKFSPIAEKGIAERGFHYADYFVREEFQIRNAVPTAEGAIAIAMDALPVTLSGARLAVIGYGRIGKILAKKLKALDADVTVVARKTADVALAEGMGNLAVHLVDGASLESLQSGYDVIFNTVPHRLFDESWIRSADKNILAIDLASAPGGFDFGAAKDCGLWVIWALSLPGKHSPVTAGKIIAQTVAQILTEEGITV